MKAIKPHFYLLPLISIILVLGSMWAHRTVMAGLNPLLSNVMLYFIVPTLFVLGIFISIKFSKGFFRSPKMKGARLFFLGFVSFIFIAGISFMFYRNSAIDFQFHSTYFVISNVHIWLLCSFVFSAFSALYGKIPAWFNIEWNKVLSQMHFWITLTCILFLMWPFFSLDLGGVPRRYYSVERGVTGRFLSNIDKWMLGALTLLLASQFLFPLNFIFAMLKKKE